MNDNVSRGASAAVARRLAPGVVTSAMATERPFSVDQTNYSVVVDEAVVVKWLRPPAVEPHRGVTLLEHLTEVGFLEMPYFWGAETAAGRVLATATSYVIDSTDGWEWYVDLVTNDLTGGGALSVDVGARLGALTARLHRALTSPSSVLPMPVGSAAKSGEHARAQSLLDSAQSMIGGSVDDTLKSRVDGIVAAIAVLDEGEAVEVQNIHGDLHVGQILRTTGDDIVLTDFDGDPVTEWTQGDALRSPMVDLASLMQSVDHVGRIVARRRPDLGSGVDELVGEATAAVVKGYGDSAAVDEPLLFALRITQELHELVYAARYLPRWRYVPEAALAALVP